MVSSSLSCIRRPYLPFVVPIFYRDDETNDEMTKREKEMTRKPTATLLTSPAFSLYIKP